ncbi:aggrecan core protein-like [Liolophura sinensis]|uniref:aggrecan core protein-like n=1 Tax=Liolophura sinensis TaxID=3198878 RepID=UPI003158A0E5
MEMATFVFVLVTATAVVTCERRDVAAIPFPSLENISSLILNNNESKVPAEGSNIKILEFGETTTPGTLENNEGGASPGETPENVTTPTDIPKTTSVYPGCLPQATENSKTIENKTTTEMPETVGTTPTEMPETTSEDVSGSGSGSGDDEEGSGELGSGEVDNDVCPQGFTLISKLNRCYLFSTVRADWFESKKRCWMRNSYLVSIETKEENDYLLREVAKRQSDFLIGGNDIDTQFKFVWDQDKRPFRFAQWAPDEPNNQFGQERCVELKYYYKQERWYWNDLPCSVSKKFICERPSWL